MAFGFANTGTGPSLGSPAANLQTGPELEDIQTEVDRPLQPFKKPYLRSGRPLVSCPLQEKLKYNYYLHHGPQINYLPRHPPS